MKKLVFRWNRACLKHFQAKNHILFWIHVCKCKFISVSVARCKTHCAIWQGKKYSSLKSYPSNFVQFTADKQSKSGWYLSWTTTWRWWCGNHTYIQWHHRTSQRRYAFIWKFKIFLQQLSVSMNVFIYLILILFQSCKPKDKHSS